MNLEQVLSTAEFVFKDNPSAQEVVAYVKGLADFSRITQQAPKNALVHINNPNLQLVNRADIEKLQAADAKLRLILEKLNIGEDEDAEAAIEALRKVEVKCQLDERGRCTFCEKRFLLTTSHAEPVKN